MTMLRLLFCVAVLDLPVSLASKPLPLHSDVVSSLLKDYNPHLVPLNSTNHTISVAAGLAIIHVDQLSQTGVLTATAWLRLVWKDYRLAWEKADYGGVTVFRIDPHKLWLPDIEVYNTAETSQFSISSQFTSGTNALVYPDGEVLYIPPVSLKVYCHNFTHSTWPQGEQECNIKLGSWTHDGLVLNLTLYNNKEEMDISELSPSSPWVITEQLSGTRNVRIYDCCPEPYLDLHFRFKVKPQYPMNDPMAVPRLLFQLLIVAITTLLVLVGGMCWAAWLNGKRWFVVKDDYSMELLREDPSNP